MTELAKAEAVFRPSSARAAASDGVDRIASTHFANDWASEGTQTSALLPSLTYSDVPPRFDVITGTPRAIASIGAQPKASGSKLGHTITLDASIYSTTPHRGNAPAIVIR